MFISNEKEIIGSFSDLSGLELFSWLGNKQINGLLQIKNAEVRKEFRYRQGHPYSFRSTIESEQLEFALAEKGIATLNELKQLRIEANNNKIAYGDYLVNQGSISKPELKTIADQLLESAIDETVRWMDGRFRFSFDQTSNQTSPETEKTKQSEGSAPKVSPDSIQAEEALFKKIKDQITEGEIDIPPMPGTLMQVQNCIKNEDWTPRELNKIIMADQILATGILKTANSSLYGAATQITSLQRAIIVLGIKAVVGVVTHQSLSDCFVKDEKSIREVLDHSLNCAVISQKIAGMVGCNAEEAFSSGLLHDIGKTVLYNSLDDSDFTPASKIDLIKRFHTETGALIAKKWNLPDLVVDVIENHHHPQQATRNQAIIEVVYVANSLLNQQEVQEELEKNCDYIDTKKIDFAVLQETIDQLNEVIN